MAVVCHCCALKYNRRAIFQFQYAVIQSFGVSLHINCLVTYRPELVQFGLSFFLKLGLIGC